MAQYPSFLAPLPDDWQTLDIVTQVRTLLRIKAADATHYTALRAQALRCADHSAGQAAQ